ncbi:MAG: hypothetical protein PF447_09405 [Spirochaetaceae bacterium]|jgi:hypothetical protein|nr:hypothetical protein [Spirochaetaceae bacterium]
MKKVLIIVLLFAAVWLWSDVNQVLDVIYQEDHAPLQESIWLILNGADLLDDSSSLDQGMTYISQQPWANKIQGETLTQGQLALLLSENYSIPQGFMYRLTGSPRYAYKDLVQLRVLESGKSKNSPVTGYELISSLGMVMRETEQKVEDQQ